MGSKTELLSRIAAGDGHGENSSYFEGWKAYDKNPFDLRNNRGGVIQMGLAENQLSLDLIEEWSKAHPEASICTAEGVSQFTRIANFQDYHGLPEFRQAMAQFMGQVRGWKATFDPDRIVMAGGATGAQETLAFCLANPGEAFLVPTPYYPGFDRDCCWRSGIKLLPIECHSSNDFRLTKEALASAYESAQSKGIRVKGILITNPSNPLGTLTDRATLVMLASFATEHRIHLICDEIYAGSVFANKPEYVSIAEVMEHDAPGCDRDLVHIAYSLSKDFGLPGFRVGIVYSYNDAVVDCARKMSSFGLVSSQTQHFLARMLSDEPFMARFLRESASRLAARHERFTEGLREVGIGCLRSNAGLFSWMDLRGMLGNKKSTAEAELELWRVIVHEVKLNVSPGTSFHCGEPGWFRVCHANMDDETMEVALDRIRLFVRRHQQQKAKAQRWAAKGQLRLSLPRHGAMASQYLNSPMGLLSPQSPLVHAAS